MRVAPLRPEVHLFVCTNRRPSDSPLGPGCGAPGEAVYARLKDEALARGDVARVWVTRTLCLGVCPKEGATVAVYPEGTLLTEVRAADAGPLYARARGGATP